MAESAQDVPPPAPAPGPVAPAAAAPAAPKDSAPPRWPQQVRQNLDRHLFFWFMLGVSVYLVVGVPQITSVFWQLPRRGPWLLGYVVYLLVLLPLYLGSLWVVLDSP